MKDAIHLGIPAAVFNKLLLLSVMKIAVITLVFDTIGAGIWFPLRKDCKAFDVPSKT